MYGFYIKIVFSDFPYFLIDSQYQKCIRDLGKHLGSSAFKKKWRFLDYCKALHKLNIPFIFLQNSFPLIHDSRKFAKMTQFWLQGLFIPTSEFYLISKKAHQRFHYSSSLERKFRNPCIFSIISLTVGPLIHVITIQKQHICFYKGLDSDTVFK